ncbi:hypothetical protein CHS0354_038725 [Potamilus streckersoni]|uniref:THD domain-containing protein n=1 Tax=Potamilus streckersoni TaxID=2493646 RepID=A0AAE0SF73_9BIVA|nr:hypothetical protein CHS0354_038725 [Potamilus streckersoni]
METGYGQIQFKKHQTRKCMLWCTFPTNRENVQSYKTLFCVAFTTNCILMAALLMTAYYWKCQVQTSWDTTDKQMCLKCEDISVHPLDDTILLEDFQRKDNGTKCCTKDKSHLKHLVHQFLERNHRLYVAKEGITIPKCTDHTNEKKPACRVVGIDRTWTGTDYDDRHLLRWLNIADDYYQNPGVTFTNGQLKIITPGFYWFNSRVTFRDTNVTISKGSIAFFHTIFRRSAEYPLREDWKLVESAKTRCKLQSDFTDRISFLGDIAYFKKGESVIVKVSHPEMVSLSARDSFLEVHLY